MSLSIQGLAKDLQDREGRDRPVVSPAEPLYRRPARTTPTPSPEPDPARPTYRTQFTKAERPPMGVAKRLPKRNTPSPQSRRGRGVGGRGGRKTGSPIPRPVSSSSSSEYDSDSSPDSPTSGKELPQPFRERDKDDEKNQLKLEIPERELSSEDSGSEFSDRKRSLVIPVDEADGEGSVRSVSDKESVESANDDSKSVDSESDESVDSGGESEGNRALPMPPVRKPPPVKPVTPPKAVPPKPMPPKAVPPKAAPPKPVPPKPVPVKAVPPKTAPVKAVPVKTKSPVKPTVQAPLVQSEEQRSSSGLPIEQIKTWVKHKEVSDVPGLDIPKRPYNREDRRREERKKTDAKASSFEAYSKPPATTDKPTSTPKMEKSIKFKPALIKSFDAYESRDVSRSNRLAGHLDEVLNCSRRRVGEGQSSNKPMSLQEATRSPATRKRQSMTTPDLSTSAIQRSTSLSSAMSLTSQPITPDNSVLFRELGGQAPVSQHVEEIGGGKRGRPHEYIHYCDTYNNSNNQAPYVDPWSFS